jgi:hypothetical protein
LVNILLSGQSESWLIFFDYRICKFNLPTTMKGIQAPALTTELSSRIFAFNCLHEVQLGLFNGTLGIVLWHAYQAALSQDAVQRQQTLSLLDMHMEYKKAYLVNHKFGYGLSGLGWFIQFLINQDLVPACHSSKLLNSIDEDLMISMKPRAERKFYSLPAGMLGKGVYFLERLESSQGRSLHAEALAGIVDKLEASMLKIEPGRGTWLDEYTCLYSVYRSGDAYFNLNFAYGIPSIIVFLGHCHRQGIRTAKTAAMIEAALRWLSTCRLANGDFPEKIYPDGETEGILHKAGWAESSLGVAMAFWVGGKVLEQNVWIEECQKVLLKAAQLTEVDIQQNTLDHKTNLSLANGASGMNWLFNKFYRLTALPELKKAAAYWFGICQQQLNGSEDTFLLMKDKGILSGWSGIGLSVMEYEQPHFTGFNWDRMFLADLQSFK